MDIPIFIFATAVVIAALAVVNRSLRAENRRLRSKVSKRVRDLECGRITGRN